MIRVLIIEDELLAANKLRRLLDGITQPVVSVVAHLSSLAEAVTYLSKHTQQVDLLLLDIHLGDGNCFELFTRLHLEMPVIFTTAYDQYAIQSFQHNSVDYLLKPVTQEALQKALDKYQRYFTGSTTFSVDYTALAAHFGQTPRRFVVSAGAKIRSVNLSDVAYFFSDDGNTFLTTKDGRTYDINFTLERLLPTLDQTQFYRINRKVIVHIDAVEEARQLSKSRLRLTLQPPPRFEVFVSSDKSVAFKQWLGE
ncbi:MAG: LytTR family DNA-binding domain-containing protein [Bacteroidota bacterium]